MKVAVLVNPNNPATSQDSIGGGREAASRLGLEIVVVRTDTEREIDEAFANAAQQHAAAITMNDAFFMSRKEQISALALRYSLLPEEAGTTAGFLMSYGASLPDVYRQAEVYVGRILKGKNPADLPVQQPTKFRLLVNLKTAKALGLKIPESFLARADEVIE